MDQNAGIASLAPAAPQPAQAGQPPQTQAAPSGVQSYIAPLSQMDMQRLLMEFNNPQSKFPKFAVLTAMQEKQKQAQMSQAMQGQQAMAQNAQQGQAPVAAGILAGAQQAAAQEAMPQYRGGGLVAFAGGGPVRQPGESDADYSARVYAYQRAMAAQNRQAAADFIERTIGGLSEEAPLRKAYRAFVPEKAPTPAAPAQSAIPEAQEDAATAAASAETASLKGRYPTPGYTLDDVLREAGAAPTQAKVSAPSGARGAAVPGAPRVPAAAATPAVDPLLALEAAQKEANRVRMAGAQEAPEVTAARAEEKRIMQENLQTALSEAKTAREAAEKRRADVVGAASRSIAEDPEALFRLAGAMNTRRGMGIGSLAGAAGAELGRRREAIQTAEEKYAGEQKDLRALDAANRQYNLSIMQLQRAMAEGKADKVRAAEQAVADSGVALQQAKLDYGLKSRTTGAAEMTARAHMISAGKPSSVGELIGFFRTDPDKFRQYIAAQVEPKNEGSLAKALLMEAVKNPAMLGVIKQENPSLHNLIEREIAQAGLTTSVPGGANIRQ